MDLHRVRGSWKELGMAFCCILNWLPAWIVTMFAQESTNIYSNGTSYILLWLIGSYLDFLARKVLVLVRVLQRNRTNRMYTERKLF